MDDDADAGGSSLWVNSMQSQSNAKNMFNVLLCAKQNTFSIEKQRQNPNNAEKIE